MNQILLIGCIFFQSCGQLIENNKHFDENGKQIVYDEVSWYTLWFEDENLQVEVIDTSCINERKRARKHIENGKLTYFFYKGVVEKHRSNNELKDLLSEFDIAIDSTLSTCISPPPGFEYYCYEKEMEKEIDRRFGINFIDSLRGVAEQHYVLKHPDKIYEFSDCDPIARYPRASNYKEHFENIKIDYFKDFIYPEDYKFKNEHNYSYTTAEFILDKKGAISDISVKTTFQNPENEKYRKLFDDRVVEFIKKTEWVPAKSAGFVVNSKIPLTIHYK